MEEFLSEHRLINAKQEEVNSENAPLWALQLYLLGNEDFDWLIHIQSYMYKCKTNISGLYNQMPPEVAKAHPDDHYVSPDQLIAFVGTLYLRGRKTELKRIWKYLLTHFFTYDNLTGKINFKRTQQLGAVLFVGACAGNIITKAICRMFIPFVWFYSAYDKPHHTSGKLKAWTMFNVLKMKTSESISLMIIREYCDFKSYTAIFKEYFPREGHPNPIAAKKKGI